MTLTYQKVKAYVSGIQYKINVNTLHREPTDHFDLNEIGRVTIKTARPLFFDSYRVNHGTGSFILIDPLTNRTVAAGMIRRQSWEQRNGHKGAVLWCTGLSGAGTPQLFTIRRISIAVYASPEMH